MPGFGLHFSGLTGESNYAIAMAKGRQADGGDRRAGLTAHAWLGAMPAGWPTSMILLSISRFSTAFQSFIAAAMKRPSLAQEQIHKSPK